jgi:NADH dehydrogenase FAD-containing subunit
MYIIESIALPLFFKLKEQFNISKNNNQDKQNIVLLGQSWFAKGFMEHINRSKFSITNIYRTEFVNTPMLLQTIKPISNSNSNCSSFTKLIDRTIKDEIIAIDLSNEVIKTRSVNISWKKGYLVCGLGSNTDIGNFWNGKINELKQLTKPQNICIVGAGPTGTELAFHLTDLNHKITLYDGLPEVYNYLTSNGKKYLLEQLELNNIKLFTNKMYSPDDAKLFNQVIFAIGSRPNDLTNKWEITPELNLKGYSNVFSGGDGNINKGLPRNAQVAYQQGKYIALKLNSSLDTNNKFEFENKGIAIYIGNGIYYVEIHLFGKIYSFNISEKIMYIYYKFFK